MNFFPLYSPKEIINKIAFLAEYGSGVFCSETSDAQMFLGVSDKLMNNYNKEELWQEILIKAICKVM
jgi:hypothetical protein